MFRVVLFSTYELGRQPFGLASPAAWLKDAGASVRCLDVAVDAPDDDAVRSADLIAFYVPMHTATRLAASLTEGVRAVNPRAHLCFYGLYAPMNEAFLRSLGGQTILGGEFESGLVSLVNRLSTNGPPSPTSPQQEEPRVSRQRQRFLVPDREDLPPLDNYARLRMPTDEERTVGYTEASRGCKHLCRHCPIVPVYEGKFRVVEPDVVLEDIRRQVAAGAQHITFGDPDFFNGPKHAINLVTALHEEWPDLTYDVTIKVEHLLRYSHYLPTLRDTGCLLVTSAVEAVDQAILDIFAKNHSREDFIRVVELLRDVGLYLNPTFVTFTPWTSLDGYFDLLGLIADLELVGNVAPVQYAIRLLIPEGSKLLELPHVRDLVGPFDKEALTYPWSHPDSRVDQLYADVLEVIKAGQARGLQRAEIFREVWATAERAQDALSERELRDRPVEAGPSRATIPYLTEPWYC